MEMNEQHALLSLSNQKQEFENQISGYESAIFNLDSYVQDRRTPADRRKESMQLMSYYRQILNEKNDILSGIRVSIFKMQQALKQYQETIQQIDRHKGYGYPDLLRTTTPAGAQTAENLTPEFLLKDISKLLGNSKKIF